jgi:hypothetical protein
MSDVQLRPLDQVYIGTWFQYEDSDSGAKTGSTGINTEAKHR